MENKRFLTAQDVMEMLDVSLSYAYNLMREYNKELKAKSNRAKYCAVCAKRMRRRKEAERQRKRYWQHEA